MPVIKDLVTDMESTHWAKIRRVTPWLLDDGDPPERERIVPPESMVDITQTIACIQCGACVSVLPLDGGRPRLHRPGGAREGLPVRRRPARRRDQRAPLRPRPGPARDLRLHALLLVHRRLPEGRRADGPDHAPAPRRRPRRGDPRPEQRPQPRGRVRQDHREEGHARRVAAAAGVIRPRDQGQADPEPRRDQGPARLDPDRDPRHPHRQDALAAEADPRRPSEAARRRPGAGEADLRPRRGAPHRAQPLHRRRGGRGARARRGGARQPEGAAPDRRRTNEARLLARLRLARLHHRAPRLDGAGRRASSGSSWSRSTAPTAAAPG